jgi:hypothetical protein
MVYKQSRFSAWAAVAAGLAARFCHRGRTSAGYAVNGCTLGQ